MNPDHDKNELLEKIIDRKCVSYKKYIRKSDFK